MYAYDHEEVYQGGRQLTMDDILFYIYIFKDAPLFSEGRLSTGSDRRISTDPDWLHFGTDVCYWDRCIVLFLIFAFGLSTLKLLLENYAFEEVITDLGN